MTTNKLTVNEFIPYNVWIHIWGIRADIFGDYIGRGTPRGSEELTDEKEW